MLQTLCPTTALCRTDGQRPSRETVALWSRHCATLNVAMVLGPGSGDTFALDIDVLDEALALRALELADDILGYTPFRRVGRAPKLALLFRKIGRPSCRERVCNDW